MKLTASVWSAAVVFAAAALLQGCGPSTYQLKCQAYEQQLADLQSQKQSLQTANEQLRQEIEKLNAKLASSTEALELQARQQRDAEAKKAALLAKLKEAVVGMPCEAMMRGGQYVVVTRFAFEPGQAMLSVQARSDLRKISKALLEAFPEASFIVAGHADNSPIQNSPYKTNWELSGARAFSVMQYLAAECGIKNEKLAYAGYGEFQPVADNATPEGREQNRRVEIIVIPQ